jgi:predicted porin
MKKSLIALAVLAASGAAFAQSTVTLYGVADLAHTNGKIGTVKSSGVASGIASGSRIGLKGTEDLGGGLSANFVMEYAVQPELATTSMANRQSFAGLAGGFGSLNIGRQYTVIHSLQGAYDPLGNHTGQGWLAGATSTVRSDKTIAYTTPTMSGFNAVVTMASGAASDTAAKDGVFAPVGGDSYSAAKAAVKTDITLVAATAAVAKGDGETTGVALNYAAGPFSAKFATETSKNTVLGWTLPGTTSAAKLSNGTTDTKRTSIGASYDLGVAKIMVVNATAEAGAAELKATSFGVSVPMGALTLGASLSNGSYTDGAANTTVKGDLDGNQFGAFYALSKRTTVYGLFGNAKIDGGAKNSSSSIGVRHTF